MRRRLWIWMLACLLCLAGAWWFWHPAANPQTKPSAPTKIAAPPAATVRSASTAPNILTAFSTNAAQSSAANTNKFALRLSNTTKSLDQLMGDQHAILLENALIDTGSPLTFSIPAHLQSQGDPGAYIIQARGPIDAAFRAMLAAAGAEIVAYIPNDAYLVRAQAGVANGLAGNPLTQAVVAYEPYYKIQSSLLAFAVEQKPLPDGMALTLGLFADNAQTTVAQIEKLGGKILAQDRSPFGPMVRVQVPPSRIAGWTALATLPGVQIVEPVRRRALANDLSRAVTGVAANTLVATNYLGLTGLNVLVQVNDSGIDKDHPDLTGRVLGAATTDTDGHGTHVAGIIAGDGAKSLTVTNAPGSVTPTTNGQFRGKAHLAKLLSMDLNESDQALQEAAAQTNALISNNSWDYIGANAYDLAAASYDAAVRDALPLVTGSQPVLFVFSAGNSGSGNNGGGGGNPDTILSPGTAKNVLTVGALEQVRSITNLVTDRTGSSNAIWKPMTDTSFQVAGYSSRGNVGVGIEGTYGRYKPDVVAPGSFVISTRSGQWNEEAYYNPTNYHGALYGDQVVDANSANYYPFSIPQNAVSVTIQLFTNQASPNPFPILPIYVSRNNYPDPTDAGTYDFVTLNNKVSIPDPDGGAAYLTSIQGADFIYAIANTNNVPIDFDIFTVIATTNDLGNYFQVLSNLNNSIGTPPYYYRYESGTSISAADVSGMLALMQQYFQDRGITNSPALLKAMVINGARPMGNYDFQVQNTINYQGWGLIKLTNSLPAGVTRNLNNATGESMLMLDQHPTNALATGDRHTFSLTITNAAAQNLPLRITLAWTDPPGDPVVAIKLVNDLNLVVSNAEMGVVYYGNNIAASSTYNSAENGTNAPVYDAINNVENVYLPPGSGTNFYVTVLGYRVNVNAVTAHTNNVVQDYALVISCGEGQVTNAFTVTDNGTVSVPSISGQQITMVTSNNAPLLNQLAGASTPLLGTNTIPLGTNNLAWGGSNGIITLGMTNQWHFYVVTNTTGFTNAAFITFLPPTLSIPRMGAFGGSVFNATRPESDIDLYVSTNAALMNLDPMVVSNAGKSLGRVGTEFVAYNNSTLNQIYYIGVYAEDQEASEYNFIPIFSEQPFSQMNPNGTESVFGVPLPVSIPDGSPAHPGHGFVFALALYPIEVQRVIVTNTIMHQNFGDLVGTLSHGGQGTSAKNSVLNNHISFGSPPGPYTLIYDDSGYGDIFNSQVTDGPGSLRNFTGQQGVGPWILTEMDNSLTQTGSVTGFGLTIEPHQDLTKGVYVTLGPLGWFYGYIDVPPGATNLTIFATNLTGTGMVDLFVRYGALPTLTDFDQMVQLTNGAPPGNSISIGPPLPTGRYWVGLYNESVLPQDIYILATLGLGRAPQATFTSAGPVPILDDAVTTSGQFVPLDATISTMEVGLRVDHPRVSDLVFHLISPRGTRVLLVENRGGTTTNGMGATFAVTNIIPVTASGGEAAASNVVNVAVATGTLTITYDFYTIPDRMVVYDQTGASVFDFVTSGSGIVNINYTNSSFLVIVMNPGGGLSGTGWDYAVNALQGRHAYLVLTEDTNKTTTPIKFAPPPFAPVLPVTTNAPAWHGSFEGNTVNIGPTTGQHFPDGWLVDFGSLDVGINGSFSGGIADEGRWMVDLDGSSAGGISTNITTVPGRAYTLSFAYARNPDSITGVLGHPPNIPQADVLIDGSVVATVVANYTNTWTSLNWQRMSVVFTATSSSTSLAFHSLDVPANISGVLLDCIDLSSSDLSDGFENTIAGDYVAGVNPVFGGWAVTTNQVTVISNTALAYASSTNLLALADGQIARILPTVPGTTYTLTYAYRGPGAIGLWRGESNAVDLINANNGTPTNITYPSGEVGQAFQFNGTGSSFVRVPANSLLDVGNYTGFTVDIWADPTTTSFVSNPMTLVEWNNNSGALTGIGCHLEFYNGGVILGDVVDPTGADHFVQTPGGNVTAGSWQHVVMTYEKATGLLSLYRDGLVVTNKNVGSWSPASGLDLYFGIRSAGVFAPIPYQGMLDEISLYNRSLSASEIKAIYNHGIAGNTKYNTNAPSIAAGLAEAQVTLNGTALPVFVFFGDNTNWQTATLSFVATSTNTPLQITGLQPGMLLDNFVLTPVNTNNYDLYYLPEQSLDTVAGENAHGQWTLEVQDDRVGATNPAPSLVSWQMHFIFTTPAPTLATLTNGLFLTNTVPPGGIVHYQVLVPTNADIATNFLILPTGPLNLLFDQFTPPIGFAPPDYLILGPTLGGLANLTDISAPTNFVPGGVYYLGVQNPNSFPVNFGIEVDFHFVPPPLVLPALPELIAYTDQLFTVTNSATGGVPPYTYTLDSTAVGNVPIIPDSTTNVITWTPITNQAPAVYTLTNIVTDSALQTATNIFHVLVVLTNGLPAFPGAEGAGGFAIGGRGGDVYHVINLNDDGPGSLRHGITSTYGSRTIVFDVSGTINLYSPLRINKPYFTIAGQTAPGDGIALRGLTTSAENTHDLVLRFLRCRPGDLYAPAFQDDSFHFRGVTNSIADHLSASWSIDEVLSTTLSTNVTVQWSMIAEPLNHSAHLRDDGGPGFQAHGYGSLIRYGYGAVSYHHNLYANNYSRNPRPGDNIRLDFINNVIFNWGIKAGYNEDDAAGNPGGYTNFLNYIGNYVIAGSNTTANPGTAFEANVLNSAFTQIYQATNFIDNNAFNGVLRGTNTGWGMFSGNLTQLGSPTPMPEIQVTTNSPAFAYEQVLAFAGASVAGASASGAFVLRDPVDTNIVAGVRNKSGQIIDFISSNSFAGVYLNTNFGVTYSGYADAAAYWSGQGLAKFVGVNPWPQLNPAPQPLDSDGDGLPDYWEITLAATGATSMDPAVPNNNHSNGDGYTDLEHFINWLAAPHALTVSNTPVAVDLYAIAGRTGNLTFGVTNGTNGTVSLGMDGHTATFMPTNTYFGFASFGFSVTNLATTNRFDVTVSVMVSVTNIVTSSLPLTNAVPQTNTVPAGGIAYYLITVPVNAQLATNILWFASSPVNLLFSQAGFPTGTNTGDYFLMSGSIGDISLLSTNSVPTNIVQGGTYYLGVQNPNGVPVSFAIEVDFYPPPPLPPPPVAPFSIASITATNIGGTNGFLLTWYAPTNDYFMVQWTTNLLPLVSWQTFTNIITYTGPVVPSNGLFSFFDDGSQTGGFGPERFYRLLLLRSTNVLTLPAQVNRTEVAGTTMVVNNTATDSNTNATLSYALTSAPAGAVIDTNGIITWTSTPAQAGSNYVFTTVVTDNGLPPAVAANSFTVTVVPPPVSIASVTFTTNGLFQLQWSAPATNYQFQVAWTTNLAAPVTWQYIPPAPPYITSTNGAFTFVDTNPPTTMKFYRLIEYP